MKRPFGGPPFSHGYAHNVARFFCGPQYPSFLDRRGWATEEDWALAEAHDATQAPPFNACV